MVPQTPLRIVVMNARQTSSLVRHCSLLRLADWLGCDRLWDAIKRYKGSPIRPNLVHSTNSTRTLHFQIKFDWQAKRRGIRYRPYLSPRDAADFLIGFSQRAMSESSCPNNCTDGITPAGFICSVCSKKVKVGHCRSPTTNQHISRSLTCLSYTVEGNGFRNRMPRQNEESCFARVFHCENRAPARQFW